MQLARFVVCAAGAAAIVLSGASRANGQTVTFSDITDAAPGRFFDAATSGADALEPNRLRIGFNSGFDMATFKFADFRASSEAFSDRSAMDTISFRIAAPEGYYISKITYSQRSTGDAARTGVAAGVTNWTVDNISAELGEFGTAHILSGAVDLAELYLTDVPVSIATSLFAFSTNAGGSATVVVTGAEVVTELLPCPPGACQAAGQRNPHADARGRFVKDPQ